jgi:hypothetical protein
MESNHLTLNICLSIPQDVILSEAKDLACCEA